MVLLEALFSDAFSVLQVCSAPFFPALKRLFLLN